MNHIDVMADFAADLPAHDAADLPAPDATEGDELAALWRMTPAGRQAAMWRGELSFKQLVAWTQRAPQEVPRVGAALAGAGVAIGAEGDEANAIDERPGEFAWIWMNTADFLECADPRKQPPIVNPRVRSNGGEREAVREAMAHALEGGAR